MALPYRALGRRALKRRGSPPLDRPLVGVGLAILDGGELQQVGTPLECYHQPGNRFVAGFIGDPSMNFFELRYDRTTGTATDGTVSYSFSEDQQSRIASSISGDRITLGIRPEDIAIAEESDPTTVESTVKVVEPMGKESLLHLGADDRSFLASVSGEYLVDEGNSIRVRFPRSKIHLFDPDDGDAIINRDRVGDDIPSAALL